MSTLFWYQILIALFQFPFFWIAAGTIFAVLCLAQGRKIKKALFSFLFTFATIVTCCGSAWTGGMLGKEKIFSCLAEAQGVAESLAAVIGCGILEYVIACAIWFVALLVMGFFLLLLSRADNQSWMSDASEETEANFSFDTKGKIP
ncbi:MAG: hypothetical protein WC730_01990 [Patescibacteria group bacterium]|jgi:hypothetical protein